MYNKFSFFLRSCGVLLFASFLSTATANVTGNGEIDWDKWDDSVIRLIVGKRGEDPSESGTAFAINDKGDYITNHHVIESAIGGGTVLALESLSPKKVHEAEIVWESQEHDLAMVHVETWKNPAVTLADGSQLKRGQEVFAVGYPGAADNNETELNVANLNKGIVSAFKNFPLMPDGSGRAIKMIGHDAPINSGNSGGPLVDTCERVVGINEQKATGQVVGMQGQVNIAEGILFSINTVELMALLKQHGVSYQVDNKPCVAVSAAGAIDAATAANAAAAQSKKNSDMAMIIAGIVALLAIIGFAFMYRRVQRANNGQFNTRVLSRMIRDRMSNAHRQPLPVEPQQQPSPLAGNSYFDLEEGRIRHRNEPTPAPQPAPQPAPISSALYRLVPERNDLGLPTLTLPVPGNYRLGRRQAANTQLVIQNQYVSGEHLLMTVNPDHSVVVEDLGSMNGTQVAGVSVTRGQLQPLQLGEALRIGHDEVIYTLQRG
jgi:S1-C subfamily serine protease/type II secretory pathway pseudopilin PulG